MTETVQTLIRALTAARELKELKPVAYFCSRTNSASTNSHHRQDKNWTPLYALEEKNT